MSTSLTKDYRESCGIVEWIKENDQKKMEVVLPYASYVTLEHISCIELFSIASANIIVEGEMIELGGWKSIQVRHGTYVGM